MLRRPCVDGDADAARGLGQLAAAAARALDDAHEELDALRALRAHKEGLLARGRAVLEAQCAASWPGGAAAESAAAAATAAGLRLESGPAGWRVTACLEARALAGGAHALVAVAPWCEAACTEQATVTATDGGALELSATLALGGDAGDALDAEWGGVHVFALLDAGQPAARAVYVGELRPERRAWLRGLAAAAPADALPARARWEVRGADGAAVEAVLRGAGCAPAAGDAGAYALGARARLRVLRGAGAAPAAVEVRAADAATAALLRAELAAALGAGASVRAAAAAATPPAPAAVAAAAGALVAEADALEALLEALLRRGAAADAEGLRTRPAPEGGAALGAAQVAALAAIERAALAVADVLPA